VYSLYSCLFTTNLLKYFLLVVSFCFFILSDLSILLFQVRLSLLCHYSNLDAFWRRVSRIRSDLKMAIASQVLNLRVLTGVTCRYLRLQALAYLNTGCPLYFFPRAQQFYRLHPPAYPVYSCHALTDSKGDTACYVPYNFNNKFVPHVSKFSCNVITFIMWIKNWNS
jgi:hypothetical protein